MFGLRKRARSILADEQGVTAIEFAFLAPVLFMLIFGILEFSFVFLASNVLENAASLAARTGKTGYLEEGISQQQYILNLVSNRVRGLLDPARLEMTTEVYESFDDVGQPEPYVDANQSGVYDAGETFTDSNGNGQWDTDMGTEGGNGTAGEIVVYTLSYPWEMMTPFMSNLLTNSGQINISTKITLKNEPFNDES
jgi:hypothetical protein